MVVAVVAALSLAGCSFFMKTKPEDWTQEQPLACDSWGSPFADAMLSVPSLLIAGHFLKLGLPNGCTGGDDSPFEPSSKFNCVVGAVFAIPGLILLGASVYGAGKAHRCSRARQRREAWLRDHPDDGEYEVEGEEH